MDDPVLVCKYFCLKYCPSLIVQMVTMRLLWMLDHVPGLREAANNNEVTMDHFVCL